MISEENKKRSAVLPKVVIKYVLWPWLRPNMPFKYIGILANSFREKHEKGTWVVIQDIQSGKLYEVLDCDLKELEVI